MMITGQGLILMCVCLFLVYRRPPMQMLCMLLWLGVFLGAAAVILSALGGSSIAPQRLALSFLMIQVAVIVRFRGSILKDALIDNIWLVLFCGWGVASAILLPRIFSETMQVVPMNPKGLTYSLLATATLRPTSQNITTAFYLTGTALSGILAHIVVRLAGTGTPLIRAVLWIGGTQLAAGLLNVTLPSAAWQVLSGMMRNGNYAQLDQSIEGVSRISGFQPEPSAFAAYTFIWLVCCCELWLRNIHSRATGAMALALFGIIMLCTSATGYMSAILYLLVLGARACSLPGYLRADKIMIATCVILIMLFTGVSLMLFQPKFANAAAHIVIMMTTEKSHSESGYQRGFWAAMGYKAFVNSYGLGIGAGSFRSSSFAVAILGSMGILGAVFFVGHCLRLLIPLRLPRPSRQQASQAAIADAFAMTALCSILPQIISSPTPDPSMEFAVLAGAALGLRRYLRAPEKPFVSLSLAPSLRLGAPEFLRSSGWRQNAR